jgi:hypothetical protein
MAELGIDISRQRAKSLNEFEICPLTASLPCVPMPPRIKWLLSKQQKSTREGETEKAEKRP